MTIDFVSLIFIWLLQLTASSTVTSDQNNNFTNVMATTPNKFTPDQLRTREASSLNPGPNVTQSIVVYANPTEEKPSAKPSLQTTPTTPSETFSPAMQIAATQTSATPTTSSQLNSSTVGMKSTTEIQLKVATSATTVVTSHASIPTAATWVPSTPSSSNQSQFTNATTTRPFTRPTPSTNLTSATNTSSEPVEHKSTSTSSVTGDDATPSTGLYKSSIATTKTPFIHITKAKDRQDPPEKSKKGTNHGKAVAGIIGGALLLMMVGFLAIYIKKRKLQRQQLTTGDWAGPSPFLEGGADNGQVTLRSSNQISLSSFLPQRLSKRLSMLPERDEEMADMTQATTFGEQNHGSTFGREVDGKDVEESNGTAVVVPEIKDTGDAPETVENSISETSSQTNDPLLTINNSEAANHSQDHPANSLTLSGVDGF
ncbi:cell wall integrity and stress response component 1-like [Sebastes umbrosus]|uniref:cell wall integrity and stress response component 1-like n=1 Tax=Sebastes umbrosus TaxID=72105 RepID=UPI00189E3570|nr:cell wall integrity and stress response component 1-like [Sebastes umbrosus]